MPKYRIVNPFFVGGMDANFNAANQDEAAGEAWSTVSKYIVNNVPQFAFTLERTSDKKLYHYLVKEKTSGKEVNYTIEPLKMSLDKKHEDEFRNKLSRVANNTDPLGGGASRKSKDDSSSSSSSTDSSSDSTSEDVYDKIKRYKTRSNSPMVYMWYDPLLYAVSQVVQSVYVPVFTVPIAPYMEINISSAFFSK